MNNNSNNSCTVDIIYFDFSRAFDSVPHNILLKKILHYGIADEAYQLLHSFLINRTQSVKVGSSISHRRSINSGVPQGSVLGPLLFLLFINDLPSYINKADCLLFADDVKISHIIREDNKISDMANLQLAADTVFAWATQNGMALNIGKCQAISFGKPRQKDKGRQYVINGLPITTTKSCKDLGVILNDNCSFDDHISSIIKKINQLNGIITYCFDNSNITTMLKLYKAFSLPILSYASVLWNPIKRGQILRLEQMQKRFTKKITPIKHYPYQERLHLLKLLPLEARRSIADACCIYKLIHGKSSFLNVNDLGIATSNINNTPNRLRLLNQFCKTNTQQQVLACRGSLTWNKIPYHITSEATYKKFKKKINQYFLSVHSQIH